MYELYDPCTTMFFFRNKHIMVDLGTGNNNKINWALDDKSEMIDLIEVYKFMISIMNPRLKLSNVDRVSWCKKGTWSGCITQGLLDEIQVLG